MDRKKPNETLPEDIQLPAIETVPDIKEEQEQNPLTGDKNVQMLSLPMPLSSPTISVGSVPDDNDQIEIIGTLPLRQRPEFLSINSNNQTMEHHQVNSIESNIAPTLFCKDNLIKELNKQKSVSSTAYVDAIHFRDETTSSSLKKEDISTLLEDDNKQKNKSIPSSNRLENQTKGSQIDDKATVITTNIVSTPIISNERQQLLKKPSPCLSFKGFSLLLGFLISMASLVVGIYKLSLNNTSKLGLGFTITGGILFIACVILGYCFCQKSELNPAVRYGAHIGDNSPFPESTNNQQTTDVNINVQATTLKS